MRLREDRDTETETQREGHTSYTHTVGFGLVFKCVEAELKT